MSYLSRMKPYWDRLVWDFKHLSSDEINPYVKAGEDGLEPKERTGLEDLSHAIENFFKEAWRKRKE